MKVKLGEVCIFQRGQTITKKDIINGDVPVVAGGQTPAYYHNKANREKNIITISSSGYAGYVNFWTVPIFCSDSFTVKPKDDNQFIIRYLYFFLKSRQEYIYSLSRGCGIKHIYSSDIAPFEIELVDIQTQKEIVSVLDKVTSLIKMRKEQLEKLDILVKSKFIEMFGDPVLNPKGWEKKKLGDYVTLISGYAFTNNDYSNSGIPVIKIGNINSGYFEPKNLNYVQENVKLNKYLIYPYDIVISLTGTVGKNDYGNLCILPSIYDKYYLNQRNAKLELINHIDKYFLYNIFKFEHIKKSLTNISRGIRQANISNNDILNLQLPIPPLDLQNQFAKFVEQVEKNKENIKSSLNQLEILYNALMQEYFG